MNPIMLIRSVTFYSHCLHCLLRWLVDFVTWPIFLQYLFFAFTCHDEWTGFSIGILKWKRALNCLELWDHCKNLLTKKLLSRWYFLEWSELYSLSVLTFRKEFNFYRSTHFYFLNHLNFVFGLLLSFCNLSISSHIGLNSIHMCLSCNSNVFGSLTFSFHRFPI